VLESSEPRLRLHLLGEIRAEYGGESFRIAAPQRSIALLAYLLVHRRAPTARDKIAFALWPDETEDDARVNLRHALHRLTRALPPPSGEEPWINADLENVQWNPKSDAWLDLEEFERRVASGQERASSIELYTGELIEGVYDDWTLAHRERVSTLYLDTLSALVNEARSNRDFGRAAVAAQRLLASDPWREDAVRSLMSARYEGGDRSGALFTYTDFARRLKTELDVDPMPETRALYEAMERNERISPDSAAEPIEPSAQPESFRTLPFVGRSAEMEKLRAMWGRAARGHGGVVFVSGEAGIGKSRLANELILLVHSQGGRVLFGATSFPESVPYQALAGALRSVGPILAALAVPASLLALVSQVVPDLRTRRPDLPDVPAVETGREQMRLFDAIAASVEGLARPRPMLVVLEDIHWAGTATLGAIEFITRRAADHPVLIVATYRSGELHANDPLRKLSATLRRDGNMSHLGLARLTIDDVGEAIKDVETGDRDRKDVASQLYGYSEGNPLFLAAALQDLDRAVQGPKRFADGPASVISRLLARLSPDSGDVADVAAVVGQSFDVDTVCAVSGWTEAAVVGGIGELLERGLVREAGARTHYDFAFAHHLIRDALYARVEPPVTRQRHRLVARALVREAGELPNEWSAQVALHLDRAGDASAALWYERAAKYALSVYAADEALDHLQRALALTADPEACFDLLMLREDVLHARGQRDAQKRDLVELDRLAASLQTPNAAFAYSFRLGRWQRAVGDWSAEHDIADRLDALAGQAGDAALEARALVFRAESRSHTGEYAVARELLEKAAGIFERAGNAGALCDCICEIVNVAGLQSSFDELPVLVARAQSLAAVAGRHSLMRALASAGRAANAQRHVARSLELQGQRLELAIELGDAGEEADAERGVATALQDLSRYDEAQQHRLRANALYMRMGNREGAASVQHDGGIALLMVGRLEEARGVMEVVSREFERLGYGRGTTVSLTNLSAIDVLLGAFAQAKPIALKALAAARSMGLRFEEVLALQNVAAACTRLGETHEALQYSEECVALARALELDSEIAPSLESSALALLSAKRYAEAKTVIDECVGIVRREQTAVRDPSTGFWAAAQIYRKLRKHRQARDLLSEAVVTLRKQLADMPDDDCRGAYRRMPFALEIEAAAERDEWPAS
jgi:DNA-binding SARP family transcriptional activator